jgi:hypothetical protein
MAGRESPGGRHSPMIAIRRGESGGGFSVLDGASIVTGAAVASIHIRGVIRGDLAAPGWALIWGTFAGVSLTAAGPFLFLARRFLRRLPDYPGVGDALWALLGLPWLLAALIRSASPPPVAGAHRDPLFAGGLGVGLFVASLIALSVIWSRWVMVPPGEASRVASGAWTNRVGLVLAVAWPIQCGLGLVVIE